MSRRDHRSRPVEAVKRPEAAEARRLRAAELLAQGRSQAEVAAAVGVWRESVRRWQARLAQGGWRRCGAAGPLADRPSCRMPRAAQVAQALRQGAKANGFATDLWTLDRVAQVVQRVTGVRLARASTWRLLVGRLGWSLQRPERQAREGAEEAIGRWVADPGPGSNRGVRNIGLAGRLRQ